MVSLDTIAKNLNIPQGTIRSIISRFKENGNVKIKPKPGRSSKVTKRDKRVLRALIKQDRRAPSRELAIKWADAIGNHVSKDTCLRNLKKMGYGFYKVGTYKIKNSKKNKLVLLIYNVQIAQSDILYHISRY
nr:unnamed protein product [Callosobruchus chinensis]